MDFGFIDKSFCFEEEVLDVSKDKSVMAIFFIDFWFLTKLLNERMRMSVMTKVIYGDTVGDDEVGKYYNEVSQLWL